MKTATTLLIAALAACANAQTTDLSPPFNPDPEFTSTLPVGSSIRPVPTLTPDISSVDTATVTGEVTLTFFTESIPPSSGPFDPPILTGTPSGRPSTVPENTDVITPTTSVVSTEIDGTSTSVTLTGILTTTTSTASGGAASTTTTGASPSISNLPAAAPKVSGGLMAVIGGVVAGVLGVAAAI
jgi:hypothetical protein